MHKSRLFLRCSENAVKMQRKQQPQRLSTMRTIGVTQKMPAPLHFVHGAGFIFLECAIAFSLAPSRAYRNHHQGRDSPFPLRGLRHRA